MGVLVWNTAIVTMTGFGNTQCAWGRQWSTVGLHALERAVDIVSRPNNTKEKDQVSTIQLTLLKPDS